MTTLGVGGSARWFFEARTEQGLTEALEWARKQSVPIVVLGGGSNVVVADRGLDALVLRISLRGVTPRVRGTEIDLEAAAGEPWDPFVELAVAEGWAGIECLSGIPGAVGATPIQNVGAYGQEVSETVRAVTVIDRASGARRVIAPSACAFGYRDSVFKREADGRFIVVAVTFALRPGGAPSVRYPELEHRLGDTDGEPSLGGVRRTVLELRRSKSMVIDPDDANRRSVGSFFMNPTLDTAEAEAVRARVVAANVLASGEAMPEYPAAGGRIKLSAAWLIERAGFAKGTTAGSVGISSRHSLAIVNRGGATASEIVAFATRVRTAVRERFGVALVPEARLVGFEPSETADLLQAGGRAG